jgi:RNA polymerase sigma-70 factor, ECF subfamily
VEAVSVHLDDPGPDSAADRSYVVPWSSASFDDFFASEYRRVVGIATVLCGRRSVGEELAQEAFVAAFRRWGRICRYDDPTAWVRRVTVNLATSWLRRGAREARALAQMRRKREEDTELLTDDPEFWNAVRALPARQAQVVALRYLEDRSVVEIAQVLGIAEATVRVHLHAARVRLAATLGEPS